MNNNNYSNKFAIVLVLIAVAALGYALLKSSPQIADKTASVDNMHSGSNAALTNNQLDSLVGKPMPEIQLSDMNGKIYKTADFKGKNMVLFFNEGLMCYPACWNQVAVFGEDKRFNSDQIQAVSVIADSVQDWQKAIAQMPQLAKATVMFDTNASVSRQLGMLNTESSMHKGALPGHTYLVIDKEGIVRYVFDDPNMAIANDMLFNKIQELNKN